MPGKQLTMSGIINWTFYLENQCQPPEDELLIEIFSTDCDSLIVGRGRFGVVHGTVQVHKFMDLNTVKSQVGIRRRSEKGVYQKLDKDIKKLVIAVIAIFYFYIR